MRPTATQLSAVASSSVHNNGVIYYICALSKLTRQWLYRTVMYLRCAVSTPNANRCSLLQSLSGKTRSQFTA